MMPKAFANLLAVIIDAVLLIVVFLLRSQLPSGTVGEIYIVAVPLLVVLLSPLLAHAIRRRMRWSPDRQTDRRAEVISVATIGLAVSAGYLIVNVDLARNDAKRLLFLAVLPLWWWAMWSYIAKVLRSPE
jgi:hypothetical protein